MSISGSTSVCSHAVVWSLGDYSETQTLSVGTTSTTLTVPKNWCNAITTSDSGTAGVSLKTYYNGTLIGQNSYTFTVTVPSSVVPSIGSISATRVASYSWSIYVQDNSKTKISVSSCAGAYGSTIRSYQFSGPNLSVNKSSTANSAEATSDMIGSSGTLTYQVTVTDSRGRTASKTVSITVYAYSKPAFTVARATKTRADKTPDESGAYITATATITHSSCNGNNTVKWAWEYSTNGSTWVSAATNLNSGVQSCVGGSLTGTYQARLTATDTLGSVTQVVISVSVVDVTMFFKKGGNGIGIGMQTAKGESETALEINGGWDIYWGNFMLPKIVASAAAPSTPEVGMIWIKLPS